MCARDGYETAGYSCAYTVGSATEMAANTDIGTATTSTLTTIADFNEVLPGTQVPIQFDLTKTMSKKNCKLNDGTAGCWGSKFTYAAKASKYEVYFYMLR